ncbi:hypothetical protein AB0E62_27350 [Streptomyces sp. NPDC038707]|uniref:hypothetical protein n=1 Tax=Streptomyces sp. NPDC038707 TaxID=3154329 RepID=UPI0033D1061C
MARTKTAPEKTPTTSDAQPDPPTHDSARPSPVLAWPSEWPVPELPEQRTRQRRTRGLPMAPVLAGASNATTLTATAAYSVGGPAAAAATGAVIVAGATAAALRRRATVQAGRATTQRLRSAGGSGLRSGSGTSGNRSGSGSGGGSRSGRSGGVKRPGSASRGGLPRSGGASSGLGSRGGSGSGTGGVGRSRGGLLRNAGSALRKSSVGRHDGPGRHRRGDKHDRPSKRQQQRAAEKAAQKALKQAAKQRAAKGTTTAAGSSGKGHALKAAAGRVARAAYRAGRPLVTRASKAAAKQARRARGALWDGICALGASAWTLLGHGRAAALDRLKAVWKRRRKQRTKAEQDATTEPAIAATVRRPTTPTPTTTTGGTVSGGHHFVAAATEMARAAAAYQPQGMLQVGQDFAGLEEALRIHAEALKTTVENADANWPLHPNIVEIMRQIHGLQLKAAELASELTPAFRQLHDVDIARLENPRHGERMWDVSANL